MGKRIEKAFGRDKTASSAAGDSHDDDPNRTPDPHVCTGHFQTDFTELCRRNQMAVIPPVILRPHRPPSPSTIQVQEEKTKPGKKDDKKNQPPPEPEPEPELDENGEPPEPPPKTYCTKEKFEYFKPTVQVEMDNADKLDTVTDIFIRGWCIDETMMTIFRQCWPKMDRLHSISLWYTGLNEETLEILAQFLPECTNLKTLVLDNNPIKTENWQTLIKDDSPIQHLSLRYNNITDKGAALLGKALGSVLAQNQKLLSINLNGNHITDVGAESLAGGLRMNRTLLSLGLAHNQIGNKGAHKLAEVLSRFPLVHEEIVERRRLLSAAPDRKSDDEDYMNWLQPTGGGKRSDSRDRPGSVRSTHGGGTKGKSANKAKKDGKKEEEKTKGKTKEDKVQKKGGGTSSGRGSGASVVAETTKGTKKGHDKGKGKKGAQQQEQEPLDSNEPLSPLLDMIEPLKDGIILLKGNMNLINLNLSHNQIGDEGMKALLTAVQYQTVMLDLKGSKPGNTGIMRLCITRNKVSRDNEALCKVNEMMHSRDPFYKPPAKSPDQDSQHS